MFDHDTVLVFSCDQRITTEVEDWIVTPLQKRGCWNVLTLENIKSKADDGQGFAHHRNNVLIGRSGVIVVCSDNIAEVLDCSDYSYCPEILIDDAKSLVFIRNFFRKQIANKKRNKLIPVCFTSRVASHLPKMFLGYNENLPTTDSGVVIVEGRRRSLIVRQAELHVTNEEIEAFEERLTNELVEKKKWGKKKKKGDGTSSTSHSTPYCCCCIGRLRNSNCAIV